MNQDVSESTQIFSEEGKGGIGTPEWLPDGTKLLFRRGGHYRDLWGVYMVNPDWTELTRLIKSKNDESQLLSPDGTKIAFSIGDWAKADLNVADVGMVR